MLRFGLITEGVTDQKVIENIVDGVFGDEAEVNPLQPLGDETYKGQLQSFGNWELVFKYCTAPDFEQAFQFNDYVIVQIDTDRCEDKNYDVSRHDADGRDLAPLEIIERVHDKIIGLIGEQNWAKFGTRVVFAISVDSIECWILVLHARKVPKTRYLHCEEPLQRELVRSNVRAVLSNRNSREYDAISRDFSKKKILADAIKHNDGLHSFVRQLESLKSIPSSERPVSESTAEGGAEDSGD